MRNESPRVLADVLAELASLSAEPFDVAELLQVATDRAREVFHCDGAIVLLSTDGRAMEPAGSSGHVGDIAALLAVETVPCQQAMRTNEPLAFVEERAHEQFPDYAALAADAGIRRVLSLPLRHRTGAFGTLSLVRLAPIDFVDAEVEAAKQLADVVSAVVVREETLRAALALSAQLEHALQTRVVIEQAKGIVAAELRVTIGEALDLIRQFTRSHRRRLADVSTDIVARTLPTDVLSS